MDRQLPRYARAIERRWAQCLDRPVVLSPRDWARITEWFERAIPLQVVLEAIDAAFETRGSRVRARPRSLAYVAPSVEESWSVVVDGRRAPREARAAAAPSPSRLDTWRARQAALPRDSALRELLDRLIHAAEAGRPVESIDAELDDAILGSAPPDLAGEAERTAERDVARLRNRVPPEALERARVLTAASWLRRRLALPRLVS